MGADRYERDDDPESEKDDHDMDHSSGHKGNEYVLGVASILSFCNEYFGLVAHSFPTAEYLYTDKDEDGKFKNLFKLGVDLIAVGGCATLACLHAPDDVLGKVYTALTPLIAAFTIPTLVMPSVLDIVHFEDTEKVRYGIPLKLLVGLITIFGLASVEGLTSKLIHDKHAWSILPLIGLLLLSMVIFLTSHHEHHKQRDKEKSPLLHLTTLAFLFMFAIGRHVAWSTMDGTVKGIVDIAFLIVLISVLIVALVMNIRRMKRRPRKNQPSSTPRPPVNLADIVGGRAFASTAI